MTTERYLRLIGGAFVMASVALGYFVNPWWFAFTAFVGANLFQSGLTNWCPMKWFLERLGGTCACSADQPQERVIEAAPDITPARR